MHVYLCVCVCVPLFARMHTQIHTHESVGGSKRERETSTLSQTLQKTEADLVHSSNVNMCELGRTTQRVN